MLAKGSKSRILPFALVTVLIGTVAYLSNIYYVQYLFYTGVAATIFLIWFFRDPSRFSKKCKKCMVSPADGKVIDIHNRTICIFMNIQDVHVNRAPIEGKIVATRYTKGSFMPAFCKESEKNERHEITIKTDHGDVKVTQIAGMIARRIISYVNKGESVSQGQRIGMICLGSRVDVSVPENFDIVCSIKDKVSAGETTIAKINTNHTKTATNEEPDEYIPDN
ncbi:MAG: phosphatidylserine decarboxylase [Methanohalobium sp.]|uniref:phosphatidylserine decarboxylase n=1 Tax=Methanohalobium sp. TaxID=2837493 RepID=UPI003979C324